MAVAEFPEIFTTNVIDLGLQKRYFPAKQFSRIGALVVAVLLAGCGLALLTYGVYSAIEAYNLHGLSVLGDKLGTPALAALFILLLAAGAGWLAYSNWNRGVGLYERGIAVRSRKGLQIWHWTDIQSIKVSVTRHYTNGIYSGTTHEYTLLDKQNQKLVLSDVFKKVEELAEAIEQGVYPLLYPVAAEEYNNGRMLNFGPVNIDKAGLQIGKKCFPWNTIKEVSVKQGYLRVAPQGGGLFSGASIGVAFIPNMHILLSIINQVVGLKTGK